jgi:Domain of Unknown Function (DUF1259)
MRARLTLAVMTVALSFPALAADIDWKQVDDAMGRASAAQAGGVHRFGFPRGDLKVTLDGVEIKPALALGGWLAFKPEGDAVMVMGDLVLTHDEINPVMKKLVDSGIAITALHNHLLRSTPATMYMHVLGRGDPTKLARSFHDALALSKIPAPTPAPTAAGPALELDTAMLDKTLGAKGTAVGGTYQFGIPRAETIRDGKMDVPPNVGTAIAINFQPTGGGKAAITGDFVLTNDEVGPVMRALLASGIEVTALHNHMLDDQPRLFFMHFWANDAADKLAGGLKAALDHVNRAKS